MVTTKHCAFGDCKNDSRFSSRPGMNGIFFLKFPGPKRQRERCKKWVAACRRVGFTIDNITKHHYICSKHFVGGNGPTALHPDPIPATASYQFIRQRTRKRSRDLEENSSQRKRLNMVCDNEMPLSASDIENTLLGTMDHVSTASEEQRSENPIVSCANVDEQSVSAELLAAEGLILLHTAESVPVKYSWFDNNWKTVLNYVGQKNWAVKYFDDKLIFIKVSNDKEIVTVEFRSDNSYSLYVLGQQIQLHLLPQAVGKVEELNDVIQHLDNYNVCEGNSESDYVNKFWDMKSKTAYFCTRTCAIRTYSCSLLTKGKQCPACAKYKETLRSVCSRAKTRPLNQKTMSKQITRERLAKKKQQLRTLKVKCKRMQVRIRKLLSEQNEVVLIKDDSETIRILLEEQLKNLKEDSFMYLFIKEQLKTVIRPSNGNRWHPLIVKWCVYLYQKSSSTYESIRNSGFVALPSKRTLYRNMDVLEGTGVNENSLKLLVESINSSGIEDHRKFVCLVHDEMNIRSDLVYEKNTGNVIGLVNLNKVGNELRNLEKQLSGIPKHLSQDNPVPDMATHMLVLQARSITSNVKYTFASYPVDNLDSNNLHDIIWEAVESLEGSGLGVLAIVSDGAGINRKFYRMNAQPGLEFPFKTPNPYDPNRSIYFISDPPHLLKTIRNCFANSNFHQKSRRLWKNGKEVLWTHVLQVYEKEIGSPFKIAHKLTHEHLYLTSFSRMRVRLAAQVMSSSVANAMEKLLGEKVTETTKFIRMVNRFFDMMNVRHIKEGRYKRNDDLLAFEETDDIRLKWLIEDFVQYFKEWKEEINNRVGFSLAEKKKMFISEETFEGIGMTANSVVEIVKFLLENGASFVLTSHLNQDSLEMEFGLQRSAGGSNENPSVKQYYENSRKIKTLRKHLVASKQGNVFPVD